MFSPKEDRENRGWLKWKVRRSLLAEPCIQACYMACDILVMKDLSMGKRGKVLCCAGEAERFASPWVSRRCAYGAVSRPPKDIKSSTFLFDLRQASPLKSILEPHQ